MSISTSERPLRKDPAKAEISAWAREAGFAGCHFTEAVLDPGHGRNLAAFVARGLHGTMEWMAQTLERRMSPRCMWADARSAIVLTMDYSPRSDPLALLERRECGSISVYARGRDYHDVIKGRLKTLAGRIAGRSGCEVKVFVDTAPLMEKPLAARAGAGWQGRHTNLVSREYGSWLFLGVILTTMEIEPDPPSGEYCGSCRACIDICPTNAFLGSGRIDARRCISYLTIEHRGPIPVQFRTAMGNRIYGCDDCLAVCPWNKFAGQASGIRLEARPEFEEPSLESLARLDDAGFRAMFAGSAVKRIGRARFLRNVLIAIGNSQSPALLEPAMALLQDTDPLIRGAAVWSVARLLALGGERDRIVELARAGAAGETDPGVLAEWDLALGDPSGRM